jgi:hypothetical protein
MICEINYQEFEKVFSGIVEPDVINGIYFKEFMDE